MIVSGSASQSLAASVAGHLDESLASVEFHRFPDGELLAAAPDIEGRRAVIVASTVSSDTHVELLQLQDAVRGAGVEEIVTVLPYMGYARQDAAYRPDAPGTTESGYPVSARAVARAISTTTDRVFTVNPHEDAVCDFFDVPASPLDASPLLADPLPDDLTDPVFIAPDANALDLAETVRDAYGTGTADYFEKTRRSGTEVEIAPSDVDVGDRDAVVVDDIIATGGTMSEAIAVLDARDAVRIFATCVHPMLTRSAHTRLARAGVAAVYGTDTIERAVSDVSVASIVVDAL